MRTRQNLTYPTGSPDEVYSIIIMFVHTRSYGKDVSKDNIMRIKAHFSQPKADEHRQHAWNLTTFVCIRLSFFIKSHYYESYGTILPDSLFVPETLLQTNTLLLPSKINIRTAYKYGLRKQSLIEATDQSGCGKTVL